MSARSYPRLGEWRPAKKGSTAKCIVCGASPAGMRFIQWSWFRGEDDGVRVCGNHSNNLSAITRAMQAAIDAKEAT